MIEINELSKKIDNQEILKNINLKLESGKIYGFVGRNGSGKSILLKTICGFLKPNHGNVIINGVDIYKNGVFPKNTRALIDIRYETKIRNCSGFNGEPWYINTGWTF